jgi:hypothetical protein
MRISSEYLLAATVLAMALPIAPASAKTLKECNGQYIAHKADIRNTGQKKRDFMAVCRASASETPYSVYDIRVYRRGRLPDPYK